MYLRVVRISAQVSPKHKIVIKEYFFPFEFIHKQEIELVFKPHPKDHDPETVAQQTRYIKTTANASGGFCIIILLIGEK